jgi:hypothetical protein
MSQNKDKGKDKMDKRDGTPPPINVDKCTSITNALMGQQVIFTGIVGQCTISPGNTTWPFNYGPNIVFPNLANPVIQIAQGLNTTPPNNVYQYVVSCCTQQNATKTVTVTG